jgi:uncharacterized protein
MHDIVVKRSGIHGLGVYANRDFKNGETVLRWDVTNELTRRDVDKLPESDRRYVSYLNKKYVLMQPPERFVNHSCDPNTSARDHCDIAIRDIKKGEEITGDYSEESIPGTEMVCNCRSIKCRGRIKPQSYPTLPRLSRPPG